MILLETTGRASGGPARAAIGFIEEPDGSLLVAAGSADAHWALNLELDPNAVVQIGDRRWRVTAEPIDGPLRNRALRELILRYGTPAEQLGSGPTFRLRPVTEDGLG